MRYRCTLDTFALLIFIDICYNFFDIYMLTFVDFVDIFYEVIINNYVFLFMIPTAAVSIVGIVGNAEHC